jgi:hypothetical protein
VRDAVFMGTTYFLKSIIIISSSNNNTLRSVAFLSERGCTSSGSSILFLKVYIPLTVLEHFQRPLLRHEESMKNAVFWDVAP